MNPDISLSLLGLELALNKVFLISEVLTVYGLEEIKDLLQHLSTGLGIQLSQIAGTLLSLSFKKWAN